MEKEEVGCMSHILIAGAGHGGLAAAAKLARAGHTVTVYEKKPKNELGHDWQDRFTFDLLAQALGIREDEIPSDIWEFRGDCAFISPAKRKRIMIEYSDETRQKIMWRKPLLQMLIQNAEDNGARIVYEEEVSGPVINGNHVTGIRTVCGEYTADLVIDAAGVFSPLRTKLPKYFQIENTPKDGDVFYAYRAYYKKTFDIMPDAPFEVYLRHEGEQGLSWFYTAEDYVDILIGRTHPLTEESIHDAVDLFRIEHPWFCDEILHGGTCAVIPVRRPLTLMVANGYAAVGDSAFMTTPMNGMGIDLSLEAGMLLADTILHLDTDDYTADVLWEYNRDFHVLYGGDTAKNEGLKNALLSMPANGVDFLFEKEVIQASDLSGAGKNMNAAVLLGKLTRGMRKPPFFFTIINGLIKGSKAASLYNSPPAKYDLQAILRWKKEIENCDT